MRSTDLDCDSPDEVGNILREAAQRYDESFSELQSAWQDKNAGIVWGKIARVLERAANQVDKVVSQYR